MSSCTLKRTAWALCISLMAWCAFPRSNHDLTIVDGHVFTMTGTPVSGAQVRVWLQSTGTVGSARHITDADGCFHFFIRHSSADRKISLSVEHADFAEWTRGRRDAFMMTAMVRLDTAGSRSKGDGWIRPREPRDTALPPCREKPTQVAAAP